MSEVTVALVGNPNCGKTSLFNVLTGLHQKVGNWAGVTVERKEGFFPTPANNIRLVDLPGLYSFSLGEHPSDDEAIARDYILAGEAKMVINVVDGSNIERHLYLTSQLLDMNVPVILVVNMLDVAEQEGIELNLETLSEKVGCPVVGMVASHARGVNRLHNTIDHMVLNSKVAPPVVSFPAPVLEAKEEILTLLEKHNIVNREWQAITYLESKDLAESIKETPLAEEIRRKTQLRNEASPEGLDLLVADARYRWVAEASDASISRRNEISTGLTEKIDEVVLNRWLGIPIFLGVMYLMFLFTQNLGGAFIDFFDIVAGGFFVDGTRIVLESIGLSEWLIVLIADGIGGGVQTVATFIPVVVFLFLFLAILEDTGYMARAAFLLDRLMGALGLPGKVFVPLITGFGCTVPAIMGARTMNRTSDRVTTIMMAPFMSCGARLPVYVLFAAAFFPTNGQNLVFALYLLGIFAAIVTAYMLKRAVFTQSNTASVMELPLYHIPRLKNIWIRTQERVMFFVKNAGKIVVIIVGILSFLNSMGTDFTFGHENTESSVLTSVGKTIVPVLDPIGIKEDNWPAAVGIFTGIFAKEAVIGTLNSLYSGMAKNENGKHINPEEGTQGPEATWSALDILNEGFNALGDNLLGLSEALTDPMGITVDDLSDKEVVAQSQEVEVQTIDMLINAFDGQSGAFAYLLMILFYMPCCAAIAAIYRETGALWTGIAATWTTGLGYTAATIFYQLTHFAHQPVKSTLLLVACALFFVGFYQFLKRYVRREMNKNPRVIPVLKARCQGQCNCKCDCE